MPRIQSIALIGLAVAAVLLPQIAEAQRAPRPWCLQSGRGGPGGGLPVCTYYSFEQCRASIGGGGDHCFRNPAILWDQIEGKRYPRDRGRGN